MCFLKVGQASPVPVNALYILQPHLHFTVDTFMDGWSGYHFVPALGTVLYSNPHK